MFLYLHMFMFHLTAGELILSVLIWGWIMFLSVRTNSQVFWLLCCSAFFQELRHEGVQSLLGLMHTTGTIPSALPPPISTLLASFNLPCNPNVRTLGTNCSTLTISVNFVGLFTVFAIINFLGLYRMTLLMLYVKLYM